MFSYAQVYPNAHKEASKILLHLSTVEADLNDDRLEECVFRLKWRAEQMPSTIDTQRSRRVFDDLFDLCAHNTHEYYKWGIGNSQAKAVYLLA